MNLIVSCINLKSTLIRIMFVLNLLVFRNSICKALSITDPFITSLTVTYLIIRASYILEKCVILSSCCSIWYLFLYLIYLKSKLKRQNWSLSLKARSLTLVETPKRCIYLFVNELTSAFMAHTPRSWFVYNRVNIRLFTEENSVSKHVSKWLLELD